jgi:D-glycero-D-manno-heptose 1,7-bisphosphate phosphatase
MTAAVFIDRDGTINVDYGYINDPEKVELIPKAANAIKLLNEKGFLVIVISNQAGIARQIMTEDELQLVNKRLMKKLLLKGAIIDQIYYCPHHPEIGLYPYRRNCSCRKPEPGMILRAQRDFNIDLSRSFVVGDKVSDVELGKRAGVRSILVLTGKTQNGDGSDSDHVAKDLFDAVKWILSNEKK